MVILNKVRDSNSIKYIIPFLFAFILCFSHIYKMEDLISSSGDAADIWKTITSFYSNNIYASYVLYKGINSVYPYVWLYQLSIALNINEWIFIKVFYATIFAYIAAIGLPSIVKEMTQINVGIFRRLLTIIFCWVFWYYTRIFTALMIDLPCLFYYVLLINFALWIYRKKKCLSLYIAAGFFCGLCLSASGQYSVASFCIIIFIMIVTLKVYPLNKRMNVLPFLVRATGFLICTGLVVGWNQYFEYTIVEPLRNGGGWIPTGGDWLSVGLSRFIRSYREGKGAITIPSNRNIAIFMDYLGDSFPELQQAIYNGGFPITILEYFRLFLQYPFDFILCYLNAFFLILSPDWGGFNFWPLFIFYTFLYIGIYIGIKKCRYWGNLCSPLMWIIFSVFWSIVPLLVMNIEPRTCIQIQGFIIAFALCDDALWNGIRKWINQFHIKSRKCKKLGECRMPYVQLGWLVFLCICFLHISTLYESADISSSEMLINFSFDYTQGQ